METIPLNKTSTRYYWALFLAQAHLPRALFFHETLNTQEKQDLFKRFVCIVNIETSAYCNRRCIYCPVSIGESRKKQFYIKDTLFNKIINELESIHYASTIVFNLYNEPLADDHIYQKIAKTREYLPESFLMFNSNGDYVTADKLTKLSQVGLNALFVTLHPSSNQNYIINDRLKHFEKFFKQIGLSQYHVNKPLENGHMESNVDWHGMRMRVMTNNWVKYGNSRAGAVNFLNASATRTLPCARPLREFTISYEGKVFPCCQFFPDSTESQKYLIDNIAFNNIFDLYASQALTQWRKNLFTFGEKSVPCDSCRDEDFSKPESLEVREKWLNRLKIGIESK